MVYTHQNCNPGARVYDVDTKEELRRVMRIDTGKGEIECALEPMRLNAAGDELETVKVNFAEIRPIHGLERRPIRFHCYGRQH